MELSQRLQRLKRRLAAASQHNKEGFAIPLLDIGKKIKDQWSHGPDVRLYVASLTAGVLLIGGSYFMVDRIQTTQSWVQVFSNGTLMGMVPDEDSIVSSLTRTATAYNVDVELSRLHTHVSPSYNWQSVASLPTEAVAIRSNGKPLVYVASKTQAQSVLTQVETALTPKSLKNNAKIAFATKVDVVPAVVSVTSVLDTNAAVHYLLNPSSKGPVGRSVSPASIASSARSRSTGDKGQFQTIQLAVSTNSSRSLLASASTGNAMNSTNQASTNNPPTSQKSTQSGPLLTVTAKQTVTKVVATKYPIQYVKTAHLGKGAVKVVRKGQPGKVQEQVEITYVNGKATAQRVVNKKVLEQPRAEVADQGTNAGIATGSWGWPTDRYDITSGYGWRSFDGGGFHPGIDIGVPIGSPVYATNNGVVVEAGWNSGGYGNWVMINNGHGIDTIFGHLSKVVVHAGETVAKGDLIGKSGSTGFSTGPHLHYEVRLYGHHVNPWPYTSHG